MVYCSCIYAVLHPHLSGDPKGCEHSEPFHIAGAAQQVKQNADVKTVKKLVKKQLKKLTPKQLAILEATDKTGKIELSYQEVKTAALWFGGAQMEFYGLLEKAYLETTGKRKDFFAILSSYRNKRMKNKYMRSLCQEYLEWLEFSLMLRNKLWSCVKQ